MKRTETKHNSSASLAVVMMTLSALLFCGTASAASKSASFQVSCTIKPTIEMAANASVRARSNMDRRQYHMNESMVERGGQKFKLYSLTVL